MFHQNHLTTLIRAHLPDYLKQILTTDVINKIFQNHLETDAWKEVVSSRIVDGSFENLTKNYHRNVILLQGRADFTQESYGLTTEDKVLLYCFYYFQMHFSSSMAVYFQKREFLANELWSKCAEILFIDIGCGPFTSGLAFLEIANHQFQKFNNIPLNYIGIDIAPSMLAKASSLEENYRNNYSNGLRKYESAKFYDSFEELKTLKLNAGVGVLLNCCYFFASSSLNVDDFISVLSQFKANNSACPIVLIYQNPPYDAYAITKNYEKFRRKIGFLKATKEITYQEFTYDDVLNFTNWEKPKHKVWLQVLKST